MQIAECETFLLWLFLVNLCVASLLCFWFLRPPEAWPCSEQQDQQQGSTNARERIHSHLKHCGEQTNTFVSSAAVVPSCRNYSFVLSRTYLCSVSDMRSPPVQCCSVPAAVALKRWAGPGRTQKLPLVSVSHPQMLLEDSWTLHRRSARSWSGWNIL